MADNHVDVYYIGTNDYHMSEYISEHFKTLRYFSNFSGSLGSLIVDSENAYLFIDGRYHTQADQETEDTGITVMKLGKKGVLTASEFLIQNYKDKVVAFDGRVVSAAFVKNLIKHGLNVRSIDLYSDIYEDRPALSNDMLYELDKKYTGLTRRQKLDIVKRGLDNKTHIISNLESIAYLLNLRGNDITYTPVFLSHMIFYQNDVYLFISLDRIPEVILSELYDDGVIIRPYESFYNFISSINSSVVLIDENKISYEAYHNINKSNRIYHMRSVVEDMKTIKNKTEIENSKMAHIYDGVAMLRFIKWLKSTDMEGLNEYDVKVKANRFRLEYKAFDLSFNTIVGYNENAAMMHYSPTKEKNSPLHNSGILLIDSGGQYFEGTTDITRTLALGEVSDEIKMYYSLVLQSMFNLARVKFIEGLSGDKLDILARKDLWELGIDYRCGTGHGVGQVLSVHEMPPNIRYQKGSNNGADTPLRPGNIFSDEPGVYFEGRFGIRLENLLLCKYDELNEYGQFLSFEPVTMVPFDLDLIDKRYLDNKTVEILNSYHATVYEKVSPYLNDEEREYLKYITRAI